MMEAYATRFPLVRPIRSDHKRKRAVRRIRRTAPLLPLDRPAPTIACPLLLVSAEQLADTEGEEAA